MLKSVKKLVQAAQEGRDSLTCGNHSFVKMNNLWYFRYHHSDICVVNPSNKTVAYDYCGYEGSPSTTRAVHSYVLAFAGYREVTKDSLT